MSFQANSLLRRLDRVAEFTGMPALQRRIRRDVALPFRIAPLLLLGFGIVGVVVQAYVPMAGWIMLMTLWTSMMPLQLTGPLRPPPGGVRDEYDRMLVHAGHFAGLATVAILAIGGCFLMGVAQALPIFGYRPIWLPHGIQDWMAVGFFLMLVEGNVALLVASWTMPRRPADDEED